MPPPFVDVDSHWTEPPDLWTSRAPAALRARVPRVRRDASGRDVWIVDDQTFFSDLGATVVDRDGRKHLGIMSLERYDQVHAASTELDARLALLDQQGVLAQVVYPNVLGFGNATLAHVPDAALRAACTEIYNDAAAELQARSRGRVLPQAVVPFWDIAAATLELERIRKLGLTGVALPDRPERFGLPRLAAPEWNGFWSAAQALELPVDFHVGATPGPDLLELPWDPDLRRTHPGRWLALIDVALFMDNYRIIANLILSGLCERFPRLRFVSVESGIGWIPFVLEACEYQFDELMRGECEPLSLRPTEYFQRQILASFYFEGSRARGAIEAIGAQSFMFESDYPHALCLYPDPAAALEPALAGLPEHAQARIRTRNAAELYGIELDEPRRA
jgi:predicted TIM-barrel fold metal-dependent hydrolase